MNTYSKSKTQNVHVLLYGKYAEYAEYAVCYNAVINAPHNWLTKSVDYLFNVKLNFHSLYVTMKFPYKYPWGIQAWGVDLAMPNFK